MTAPETPLSRRAFLVTAAAVTAGCTTRPRHRAPDPDAAALAAARAAELTLIARYAPGTAAYDAHVAHLRALGGSLPSPAPGGAPTAPAAARAAERATVPALQAAATSARSGATAATLASVAAAHAVLGAS